MTNLVAFNCLEPELAALATARFYQLQAIRPFTGRHRGQRIGGLIHAYSLGWVGNRQHGLRMLALRARAGRRKPGKVDYGKPYPVPRKSQSPRAQFRVVRPVAAVEADEYPC